MSENNFDSGLWEYRERPPCVLTCDHCNKTTEYVCTWAWKNLTELEIFQAMGKVPLQDRVTDDFIVLVARAVEAKLKEKNIGQNL